MIIITRILRSSINALKSKKKRTFLSIIGIIIGVVTIIIILSICDATNSYLMGEYNKVGDNLMWVTMEENMNGRNETNVLNSDSLQIINKVEFVNDSSPYVVTIKQVENNYQSNNIGIVGVDEQYWRLRNFDLTGRFFSKSEMTDNMRVCVISDGVRKKYLYKNINPIGETLKINGQIFIIIGYINQNSSNSSTGLDESEVIYIPYTTCTQYFQTHNFDMIMFSVQDKTQISTYKGYLKQRMKNDYIKIDSVGEHITQLKSILDIVQGVAILFAVVSLIVSGIGIMNVMLISIEERKIEIGLRKAVGASNNAILLQFLFESIIICAVGIFVGIMFSLYVLTAVTFIMNISIQISYNAVIISTIFCLFIGVIFGIGPANKAAKLEPLQCLEDKS